MTSNSRAPGNGGKRRRVPVGEAAEEPEDVFLNPPPHLDISMQEATQASNQQAIIGRPNQASSSRRYGQYGQARAMSPKICVPKPLAWRLVGSKRVQARDASHLHYWCIFYSNKMSTSWRIGA